jgi:hypothetical protein
MKATTRSDQLPATVQHHFLQQLGKRSLFWRELFEVSLHLGLRNVEARELTADMVDLDKKTLHLFDSKQVRSHITKQANKWLDASWLKAGKKLVRIELKAQSEDALAALVTTAAVDSVVALDDIADQFDIDGYQAAKEAHYAQHIEQARQEAARTAPSGRIVDLSPFPGVISILRKRIANLQPGNSLLFPANELNSNRARGQGFEPVSRQSAKRIVDIVAGGCYGGIYLDRPRLRKWRPGHNTKLSG